MCQVIHKCYLEALPQPREGGATTSIFLNEAQTPKR